MLQYIKNHRKKIVYCFLAFLIPLAAFRTAFYFPGVSKKLFSILTSDLNGQYVEYFSYFYQTIKSGKGLVYSFSMSLGSDTFSMLGYYMFSPFNLLVFLFPLDQISNAIFLIITLKISLTGAMCYLFLDRDSDGDFRTIVFACSYALSGYVFTYFMNLMWLDALYMLPLVLLGVERIFRRRQIGLYCISLTFAMLFCYYTGYMVAGCSVLYVIYLLISGEYPYKNGFKALLHYAGASVLTIFLSAFFLLPTMLSQFVKNRVSEQSPVADLMMLGKFFTGTTDLDDFERGMPQIYCGMLIMIFFVMFFLSRKIHFRKKLGAIFLFCSVFISFCVAPLNLIWHGFSNPNDFLYRYSYALTFFMVIFAQDMFCKGDKKDRMACIAATILVIVLGAVVGILQFPLVKPLYLVMDGGIAILICGMFCTAVKSDQIDRNVFCGTIGVIAVLQMIVNGASFAMVHPYDDFSHDGYYHDLSPVIDRVKPNENEFYRVEKTFYNNFNDAMLFTYPSITHFSSAWSASLAQMLDDLGYSSDRRLWVNYGHGASPALDSLLGVKYFISKDSEYENYPRAFRMKNYTVFENPQALPIGMVSTSQVLQTLSHEKNMDPFAAQQQMYRAISGEDALLFVPYAYETQLNQVNRDGAYYTRASDEQGSVTLSFEARDGFPVYLFLPATWYPGLNMKINGKDAGECLTLYDHGIIPLGCFKPGEIVNVELVLQQGYVQFEPPFLYSLDMSELGRICNGLQGKGWEILAVDNDEIHARISVQDDQSYVFTTIPYDKSWEITVDGSEVQAEEALSTFVAFPIAHGEHIIEMKYHANGMLPGLAVSLGAWGVLIVILLYQKKNQDKVTSEIEQNEKLRAQILLEKAKPDTQESRKEQNRLEKKKDKTIICPICQEKKVLDHMQEIDLFTEPSSEESMLRYPGWDKLSICKTCLDQYNQYRAILPRFFAQIREWEAEGAQEYTFELQFIEDAGRREYTNHKLERSLTCTCEKMQKFQKAIELEEWVNENLEESFLYSEEKGGSKLRGSNCQRPEKMLHKTVKQE